MGDQRGRDFQECSFLSRAAVGLIRNEPEPGCHWPVISTVCGIENRYLSRTAISWLRTNTEYLIRLFLSCNSLLFLSCLRPRVLPRVCPTPSLLFATPPSPEIRERPRIDPVPTTPRIHGMHSPSPRVCLHRLRAPKRAVRPRAMTSVALRPAWPSRGSLALIQLLDPNRSGQ